jgi:hypothetical protein
VSDSLPIALDLFGNLPEAKIAIQANIDLPNLAKWACPTKPANDPECGWGVAAAAARRSLAYPEPDRASPPS